MEKLYILDDITSTSLMHHKATPLFVDQSSVSFTFVFFFIPLHMIFSPFQVKCPLTAPCTPTRKKLEQVAFTSPANAAPYLYSVPPDLACFATLLKQLGVRPSFGPSDFCHALRRLAVETGAAKADVISPAAVAEGRGAAAAEGGSGMVQSFFGRAGTGAPVCLSTVLVYRVIAPCQSIKSYPSFFFVFCFLFLLMNIHE